MNTYSSLAATSLIGGSFTSGVALSRDLLRPEQPYQRAQLLVRLSAGVRTQDLDGLSVWCSEAGVSFGDVAF